MKLSDIKTKVLHSIDKDELGEYTISGTDLPLIGFEGNAIAKAIRDTGYPTYLAIGWNNKNKKPIIKYDPEATKGRIVKYLQVYVYDKPKKVPEPAKETPESPKEVKVKTEPAKVSEPEPIEELDIEDLVGAAASVQAEDITPVEKMKSAEIIEELKTFGYTDKDISILDGLATKRQELKNARELGRKL